MQSDMQCHCMMGLFPDIHRAWLTIDSDIYIWTYEHGYVKGYSLSIQCYCFGFVLVAQ